VWLVDTVFVVYIYICEFFNE